MRKGSYRFSLATLVIAIISFFNVHPTKAQYLAIEAPDLEIIGSTDVTAGIPEGYTLQATLRGVVFPISAKWSCNNPRVASISGNGVLTTTNLNYEYEIELVAEIPWYEEYSRYILAVKTVTVFPPAMTTASAARTRPVRLQRLALSAPASLENGTGVQMTLSARYSDGRIVDVTNAATWTVTPAESATVSAGFLSINSNPKVKRLTVAAAFLDSGRVKTQKKTIKITQPAPTPPSPPPPPPPTEPLTIVSWGFLPSSPKVAGRNQSNIPIYAGAEYSDGSFRIISWDGSTQWLSENPKLAWFPNRPGPTGGMLFTGSQTGLVKIGFKYLYQSVFYESQMWITVQ